MLSVLSRLVSPLDAKTQLIHSDLCIGNVIFRRGPRPGHPRCLPCSAAPAYAEAILLADAVLWEEAPLRLIESWLETRFDVEILVRACLFRLYAACAMAGAMTSTADFPGRSALFAGPPVDSGEERRDG